MELGSLFELEKEELPVGSLPLTSDMLLMDYWDSPLGQVLAVFDRDAVCWLSFMDGEPEAAQAFLKRKFRLDIGHLRTEGHSVLKIELDEYFDGKREEFSLPLKMRGTDFQRQVWGALREIPYGQSMSYSDLATKVGVKNGQRAVGKANGDNPVSILVPCHRVVRSDGDLCGYAGGLWRKQRLLGIESGQAGLF